MRKIAAALLASAVALGFAGCGEGEQVVVYKQGKYQGKPDTRPWDNEPLAMGPKWSKGDKASWETQIKQRNLAQHEDRRIYHQ